MSINETVKKTIINIQTNSQINSFELLFFAIQNPSAPDRAVSKQLQSIKPKVPNQRLPTVNKAKSTELFITTKFFPDSITQLMHKATIVPPLQVVSNH